MKLPPCHLLMQFYVSNNKLSCQMYQRSADMFLGVPFNIASYSLLTHIMARLTGLEVGELVHTIGDAHIYSNHTQQVDMQLEREPYELPQLHILARVNSVDTLNSKQFRLIDYTCHPPIKAPIAV